MLDYWLDGNAKGLARLVADGFENNNDLQKLMLEDRNRQWFDKLHSANQQNMSVLSVVGAGHLVGPDSILNLFKTNGYVITAGSQPQKD
ncbi:MAG: TraB/GumN family protein, partial [Victivallales bacterium]|nr:TraB/GumN family protein [Victivallales bacterium]